MVEGAICNFRARAMREMPGYERTRLRISDSMQAVCSELSFISDIYFAADNPRVRKLNRRLMEPGIESKIIVSFFAREKGWGTRNEFCEKFVIGRVLRIK